MAESSFLAARNAFHDCRLRAGNRVALAVGSRGIGDLPVIVRSLVDACRHGDLQVEIIPAMGSHGGGTAEGQREVLEGLGISSSTMGVPVRSSIDVKTIGSTTGGVPVMVDATLGDYDAVIPVNRIKPHTDYYGDYESGLCKMLAIGLGNHEGCSRLHQEGFSSFPSLIPEVARIVLDNVRVPFGLAIVENAFDQTLLVEAIPASRIHAREKELLQLSYRNMPRIRLKEIDVLVVERIGKDISGAGMDPNVVGRTTAGILPGYDGPTIRRIVVGGITPASHGNAIGVGLADFVTKELSLALDPIATGANAIASGNPESGRLPIVMERIDDAIRGALLTAGVDRWIDARIVRISDTLHLETIYVSPTFLSEVEENPDLELIE